MGMKFGCMVLVEYLKRLDHARHISINIKIILKWIQ
jgi:predicted PP-loop superfamily ATPase